jgi:hypothetical protein
MKETEGKEYREGAYILLHYITMMPWASFVDRIEADMWLFLRNVEIIYMCVRGQIGDFCPVWLVSICLSHLYQTSGGASANCGMNVLIEVLWKTILAIFLQNLPSHSESLSFLK